MKAYITLLCLLLCGVMPASAQRHTLTINDSWRFYKGECAAAADSAYNDKEWAEVQLPHTWNTDAYKVKDYYRGTGWYRRTLNIPAEWSGRQLFLKFDAASKAATVYVNGRRVGDHAGGYTAFTFDITSYVTPGKPNSLAVMVDNARTDIAPISADFTFFGGIYRDVWLTAVPKQHINLVDHGSDGVFVSTPQVTERQAMIAVRGSLKNDAKSKAAVELVNSVWHPDGHILHTSRQTIILPPGETRDFSTTMPPVANPLLWTPETPHLYKVVTVVRDRKTKAELDRTEHYAGLRWFSFDAGRGFFLNGKPYKLRGICRHQDQKPVGVAMTDEMHRRDFRLMKDMGANFIRISHYPQDDALLEMCDRMGMLAWEEIPVIDIVPDTPGYGDNCERNLREMIRQHYSHPCVVTWGYMNEILLVTQRRYKTEAQLKPVLERTLQLAKRLEKVLKEEDNTRVSTMAFHGSDDYNRVGLSSITDIVGWNLYNGWYGGSLSGFEQFLASQHSSQPGHPMIVSEYGAGSDRRLHSMEPKAFDFSMEYQQKYLEHYLPVLENTDYVCGGTHWNFIDFSSALRDESMPRINNKGLVGSDRTPKDVYYYYKAAWRKDIPVVHIASRDWTSRTGISHDAQPVMQPVKVYTNMAVVELFADGKPLGRQKTDNYMAIFQVPFTSGRHFIKAIGFTEQGMTAADGNAEPAVADALMIDFNAVPAKPADLFACPMAELAVNVGSNCFFTSDESNLTWLPDQPYTQGSWGYVGGKAHSTQTEIVNTADGPLFQTLRNEIEGYRFDVPQGGYELELLFADVSRNGGSSAAYLLGRGDAMGENGENVFSVTVNGTAVDNLSPGWESGYFHATRKKYYVTAGSNGIDIRFAAKSGKCFLNAIKLRKL